MSATWKSRLAVTVLVGATALSSASLATASGAAPGRSVRRAPATSLALVPLVADSAALTSGLTGRVKASASIKADVATGTAISPDGGFALVCDSGAGSVISVSHARTRPNSSSSVVLSRFKGEGGATYHWFPGGVSFVGGSRYAVVTGNGQGLVQLVRAGRRWAVDSRVHSPGVNAAGHAHRPGLIAIPDTASGATLYDGIAVSQVPAARGKYLGVAIDRTDGTLAVLSHLGTGHPRVESTLASPLLEDRSGADYGSGGVAFSPVAPTRVAVQTSTGLAVLDLSDLAHPALQSLTTTPAQPQSIAAAPHGNRVLVGSGNHLYLYSGLLVAGSGSPLTPVATLSTRDRSSHSPEVSSIAYLATGSAVVVHGDDTRGYSRQTLLRQAELSSARWGRTHVLKSAPDVDNALSVWPAPSQAIVAPHLRKRMKVHQRVLSTLSVHPVGSVYSFTVASGKLPPHLHLRHGRITGRLTRVGHFSFTILAENTYGATVLRHFSIQVRGRR